MLRIIQNISAASAKTYYSSSDYYTEGQQELEGLWRGEGAKRLNLSGKVERDAWESLCDNRDPNSGLRLTARRKTERRVGYDFNFHACKSLSLVYGLTRDERLLTAFRETVGETMREMEAEMQTRVRRNGKNEDRTTGNMVWGEFIHFTSRPVNEVPDPHLHAHAFVFNTTWDESERRWKAGQFAGLKSSAPYFEAVFQSKLARRVAELGLPVARTKTGWEIEGLNKETLAKFSRRTALIEKMALANKITSEAQKAELGAKTREKKQKNLTMEELRSEWWSRLSNDERGDSTRVIGGIGKSAIAENPVRAKESVRLAVDHLFERESVVTERKLLREALRRSYGHASRESVERGVSDSGLIVAEREGRRLATTKSVLAEETAVVRFARDGRGTCAPLGLGNDVPLAERLSDEQRRAAQHVLQSSDRVILVRGAAGVGKTTMMSAAVSAIESGGKKVFTFAPSAGASRGVLRSEGFDNADTVARLLADEKMQAQARGNVLWIDEAGLLGVRTMKRVFDLADKLDARVVLSGDDRQHGSVEAGAALRLLESEAGLVPAEIVQIRRQQGEYRQAVMALSEGRIEDGFRRLNAMGAIKEVPREDRYKALAQEYVGSIIAGKRTLIVSPTHLEGEWVTEEVRSTLRTAGLLGKEQRMFQSLENANLTVAERCDAVNLMPGDVIVYHQNAPGHRKGERVVVGTKPVKLDHANRFTVFHPAVVPLSPGDAIRITQNGESREGKRVSNGDLLTVKGFTEDGHIELTSGVTLDRNHGHFAHGYAITSYASQGRTVEKIIIAESSNSFAAASREQFYVSVSRGKKEVSIYTDDREALLEAVSRGDKRLTATEFVAEREYRVQAIRAAQLRDETTAGTKTREGITYER